jgi:hypothetical protein
MMEGRLPPIGMAGLVSRASLRYRCLFYTEPATLPWTRAAGYYAKEADEATRRYV